MRPIFDRLRRYRARSSRGQSLTEFALFLPVLLLLLLIAIDFGRVYLGWVNLQQMARIAASFAAEHASAWIPPGDASDQARYDAMVLNDASFINCDLPDANNDGTPEVPQPIFAAGTALGAPVSVQLSCEFSIITPVISAVLGDTVVVGADIVYPVKEGAVADVAGGGIPIVPPPVASFIGSPKSGWAPLEVTFIDTSTNSPTSWTWDFSVGASGPGADASPGTSLVESPPTVTYDCVGSPGAVCRFGVQLTARNGGGSDTTTINDYIEATVPPATAPLAEFTAPPRTGTEPLVVDFQFVDVFGSNDYTAWEWDFGDGATDNNGPDVTHTYASDGTYDVGLRVTNPDGTNALTKQAYVVVTNRICTVPDFQGIRTNTGGRSRIQSDWTAAEFTGSVTFLPGPNNYVVQYQLPVGGVIDPQPLGCATNLTVGP